MLSLLIWILTLYNTFSQALALPGTQTRFSQEPADQTVVAGQRAVLPCVLLNYSGIVQWTKDGLALGMGQGLKAWPRYRVVGSADAGQYNLEITEPTPSGPSAPGGTDTTSQLSYENYEKFNSHPFPGAAGYPTYRLGYPQAPPSGLERTPYEAYDPIGKYATATRFSYTSQHSDYGQRFQQRMQTHV